MTQQRVLFVSPEVYPFKKFTSASEICAGLPKYIKEYGHEVRVVMPKYKSIIDHKFVLRDVIRLKEVPVRINNEEMIACVKSSFIPDSKVQIYFVEIPGFFHYDGFYGENGNIRDGVLRELAFFSKATLELLKILFWFPDLIHTNEWHSGLLHYYLRNEYEKDENYRGIKTVFSLHNLEFTGIFKNDEYEKLGIHLNGNSDGSLLKYAVNDAEVITLNNEESLMTYQENDFFKDFQDEKQLEIIPHGYDDLMWNPQAKKMKQVYTLETIDQKEINRKYLTHKKDLDLIENAPVLVINMDGDYEYIEEVENWVKSQEEKDIFIVITSIEKDLNRKYEDFDWMGDNYVFLRSSSNDELKNYIAASDFYINLCNRSYYNHRFGISIPFGTVVAGERCKYIDQFVSIEEDEENFNCILVNDISNDFSQLIDKIIYVYKNMNLKEVQRRVMSMLISWSPSGMRIGKVYDNL